MALPDDTEIEIDTSTCGYCGERPAIGIKQEVEEEYDEEGNATQRIVKKPICTRCNEEYFDGTEEYPKLLPLN